MIKISKETFIKKATLKHNGKYDYSKSTYIKSQEKLIITCPIHGDFVQRPDMHINRGDGCPLCKKANMVKSNEDFINELQEIFKDKFDYSKIIYTGVYDEVNIVCKKHGEFKTKPNQLLKGQGCPLCNEYNLKLTTEKFIEKAKIIHGNKFIYDNSIYINSRTKIEIICPSHGSYFTIANNHLHKNKYGCPMCDKSKGEIEVENILNKHKISYKPQFTFPDLKYKKRLRFDFGISKNNELKCLIEFNGKQHYNKDGFMHKTEEDFALRQLMDKMKIDYCKNNNIPLHIIRYDEDITERLQKTINEYEKC